MGSVVKLMNSVLPLSKVSGQAGFLRTCSVQVPPASISVSPISTLGCGLVSTQTLFLGVEVEHGAE